MTEDDRIDRLAERISELSTKMDFFAESTRRNEEVIGGTAKTGGLKERIAIAEDNIERNKASFKAIETSIIELKREMLIEVGNVQRTVNEFTNKKKGVNWESVWQVVVTSLAVGVAGIVFWQIVVWLAANAPN